MQRFEIVIENEQPLSFMELREIVELVDDYLAEYVLRDFYWEDFDFRFRRLRGRPPFSTGSRLEEAPQFSFVEIESVRSGSIVLTVVGGAAMFTLGAVAMGIRRSRLGSELARFGENVGEILGAGVSHINDHLEDWSDRNLKIRDRKTRVSFRPLLDEKDAPPKVRKK